MSDEEALLERWRVAGMLLNRLAPDALKALVIAAEMSIAQTPEQEPSSGEVPS
jgi:hypothetical protein